MLESALTLQSYAPCKKGMQLKLRSALIQSHCPISTQFNAQLAPSSMLWDGEQKITHGGFQYKAFLRYKPDHYKMNNKTTEALCALHTNEWQFVFRYPTKS